MTYVESKGLSGRAADLLRGNENSTHIFDGRDTCGDENLLKNHPCGLSMRAIVAQAFENWESSPVAPARGRGERERRGNVPTNGIDPSLPLREREAASLTIDTRCQERTDRSELQPGLRTTRRPQSFREITGNAILPRHSAMRLINDPASIYSTRNRRENPPRVTIAPRHVIHRKFSSVKRNRVVLRCQKRRDNIICCIFL